MTIKSEVRKYAYELLSRRVRRWTLFRIIYRGNIIKGDVVGLQEFIDLAEKDHPDWIITVKNDKNAPESDWAIFEKGRKTFLKRSVEKELNRYFFNCWPDTTDMLSFREYTLKDLGIDAQIIPG